MTEEIDQVVMKWQIAAFSGNKEDAIKYQNQYMKLALKEAMKK